MNAANIIYDAFRNLWNGFLDRLPSLVTGVVVLAVFYLAARGMRFLIGRSLRKLKASEHAAVVVSRLSFVSAMFVGALVALGVMGVNAGALVASLGLVSVGIGFALKDVIENFLAGMIIIVQRPFVVGDAVCFGDVEGIVDDVRVRDTVIRSYDGRTVYVPNAALFSGALINMTSNRRRRLDFEASISHDGDIAVAMRVAAEALRGVPGVLEDPPPLVVVTGIKESGVGLRAYLWLDPVADSALEVKSEAVAAVKQGLTEAGVELWRPMVRVERAE